MGRRKLRRFRQRILPGLRRSVLPKKAGQPCGSGGETPPLQGGATERRRPAAVGLAAGSALVVCAAPPPRTTAGRLIQR
jgi:hypothetical protein